MCAKNGGLDTNYSNKTRLTHNLYQKNVTHYTVKNLGQNESTVIMVRIFKHIICFIKCRNSCVYYDNLRRDLICKCIRIEVNWCASH